MNWYAAILSSPSFFPHPTRFCFLKAEGLQHFSCTLLRASQNLKCITGITCHQKESRGEHYPAFVLVNPRRGLCHWLLIKPSTLTTANSSFCVSPGRGWWNPLLLCPPHPPLLQGLPLIAGHLKLLKVSTHILLVARFGAFSLLWQQPQPNESSASSSDGTRYPVELFGAGLLAKVLPLKARE